MKHITVVATYFVARHNKPYTKIPTNGGQPPNYRVILISIATHLNIDYKCLELEEGMKQCEEPPQDEFFQFPVWYKEQEWRVFVEQVTNNVFFNSIPRRIESSKNPYAGVPEMYQNAFLQFFNNLEQYLEPTRHLNILDVKGRESAECANKPCQIPNGWFGFGIRVDTEKEAMALTNWHIGYHCTSIAAINSIIQHKTMALPGDLLLNGTILSIPPNHIQGENFIFASPCLAYSVIGYGRFQAWNNRKVDIALELRMRPDAYLEQEDTLDVEKQIAYHPGFTDSSKIEWKTEIRGAVVVTKIWMRIHDEYCCCIAV